MVRAIMENRTPNLYALHYHLSEWAVANVILIPHFAFPLSAIEKRKPLAETARRAGWVGCNILLHSIPPDARIKIISNGKPVAPAEVQVFRPGTPTGADSDGRPRLRRPLRNLRVPHPRDP